MNLEGLTFSQKLDVLDEYRAAHPLAVLPFELQEFRDSVYKHREVMELRKREKALRFFLDAREKIFQVAWTYREAVAYTKGYTLLIESTESTHRLVSEMLDDIRKGAIADSRAPHRLAEKVLTDTLESIEIAKSAGLGAVKKIEHAKKLLEKMEAETLQKAEGSLLPKGSELESLRVTLYSVVKALKNGAKAIRYRPPTIINFLNEVLALVKEPVTVELPALPGKKRKTLRRLTTTRLQAEPEIYRGWLKAVKEMKG